MSGTLFAKLFTNSISVILRTALREGFGTSLLFRDAEEEAWVGELDRGHTALKSWHRALNLCHMTPNPHFQRSLQNCDKEDISQVVRCLSTLNAHKII